MSAQKRRCISLAYILTLATVVCDQITKVWIDNRFSLNESSQLIGEFLKLTYIRNPNAVFGIPLGGKISFILFLVIIPFIFIYLLRLKDGHNIEHIGLALILGGAIGNFIDRVRFGEVVDFIDIGIKKTRWPIFNFADAAVTVGVALIIITELRRKK